MTIRLLRSDNAAITGKKSSPAGGSSADTDLIGSHAFPNDPMWYANLCAGCAVAGSPKKSESNLLTWIGALTQPLSRVLWRLS